MSDELIEGSGSTMDSGGTFGFEADASEDDALAQDRAWQQHKREQRLEENKRAVKVVLTGQNRVVELIAKTMDEVFPPEEYGQGHGTGYISPGDLVRQFKVDTEKMLQEMDEEARARGR